MKELKYTVIVFLPYYSNGKEKDTIKGESFVLKILSQWSLDDAFPDMEFYEIFLKNKLISFN